MDIVYLGIVNRLCFADVAAFMNCKQLVMLFCVTGLLVETLGQSHVSEPLHIIFFC